MRASGASPAASTSQAHTTARHRDHRGAACKPLIGPAVRVLSAAAVLLMLWLTSREVAAGAMSAGDLVSLLLYGLLLTQPMSALAGVYGGVQTCPRHRAAADRDVSAKRLNPDDGDRAPDSALRGEIVFERGAFPPWRARAGVAWPRSARGGRRDGGDHRRQRRGQEHVDASAVALRRSRLRAHPARWPRSARVQLARPARCIWGWCRRTCCCSTPRCTTTLPMAAWRRRLRKSNTPHGRRARMRSSAALAGRLRHPRRRSGHPPFRRPEAAHRVGARAAQVPRRADSLTKPRAMFDPAGEREFIDECHDLLRHRTVLLITHRPASLALADRVLRLESGAVGRAGARRGVIGDVRRAGPGLRCGALPSAYREAMKRSPDGSAAESGAGSDAARNVLGLGR